MKTLFATVLQDKGVGLEGSTLTKLSGPHEKERHEGRKETSGTWKRR